MIENGVVSVRENGLVADFFSPKTKGKHPGIIVIGGSQGGIVRASATAELLATAGYAALAVAYFKFEQLPKHLIEIPLECFKDAIDWMCSNPSVDADRLGFMGVSKGGEASLLVGATYSQIKAVVAYVPSHVVFQGIDYKWPQSTSGRSSWTLQGKPMPFVPYRFKFQSMRKNGFLRGLYLGSLQDLPAVERAIIHVERTKCPVMLVSGKKYPVWPSSLMCSCIENRLNGFGFSYPFKHLSYDDAGHISPGPSGFLPANPLYIGGTKAGNGAARDAAWKEVSAFFEMHLKK